MYKIWKLYDENYSSYRVRTKVLTKFSCDLDLWTPKCIGIFLSSSGIYVWNMKAVRWKLLIQKLLCQNQSVYKVQLWPWLLTLKCIGIFLSSSCIYVWNMKAVRWKLFKLLCQNQSVDKVQLWPWPLDPKMYRYLPLTILHLCMKYESCRLKTTQVIVSEPKSWQSFVMTLTFGPSNV